MCLKKVYYNTYVDGEKDVTQKVESCAPGFLCTNPRIEEHHRHIPYTKAQYSSSRKASPLLSAAPVFIHDPLRHPPTPRSMSPPGSRGSDADKRHRRSSVIYDGVRVVDVSKPDRSPRRRVPFAPEPPSPRPIPIKRSSTMPWGMETPPERGRRPIIIEDRVPTSSRHVSGAVPIGPVEIVEHASSQHLRRRQSRQRRDSAALLTPYWSRSGSSPQGYGSAEDEAESRDVRRRRREARERAILKPSSVPTSADKDVLYASSFGSTSSWGASSSNGSRSSSPRIVGPSAAVSAVKKELRWEDQMRREQNARIESRPKLSRSATVTGNVQGEVKSILKNAGESSPRRDKKERSRERDDDLAELYRSVEGLNLQADERETSRERRTRNAEEKDSAAYMERLRNRFSMPPRRYTAGSGTKRRHEIWYPDEGRYKYKN